MQVRLREVAVRLRLVHVEARNGIARRAQPRDFALERDQVDLGPLDPCSLLGACQRQLARIETGDELAGLDRRAGLRHPLQPSAYGRRKVGRGTRAHDAGRAHGGRQLPQLDQCDLDRSGPLLLGECGRGHRDHGQQCKRDQGRMCDRPEPEGPGGKLGDHAGTLAMAAASGAATGVVAVAPSPSRNRLGISTQVNSVPTVMPPATTAARPR